jgi:hypothetical protein
MDKRQIEIASRKSRINELLEIFPEKKGKQLAATTKAGGALREGSARYKTA